MMTTLADSNTAFERSVELLLQLHKLNLEGKDESEEADRIRDESQAPWWDMTEKQRELFCELSEVLNRIEE